MTRQKGEPAVSAVLVSFSSFSILNHSGSMTIPEIYNIFKSCACVTTDSRSIKGGEMFFALKGENFDGNEYALSALAAGAAYAVVNAGSQAIAGIDDPRLIKVEDTLKTLQELARWHRSIVAPKNEELLREEHLKKIEEHMGAIRTLAKGIGLKREDVLQMWELMWEESE